MWWIDFHISMTQPLLMSQSRDYEIQTLIWEAVKEAMCMKVNREIQILKPKKSAKIGKIDSAINQIKKALYETPELSNIIFTLTDAITKHYFEEPNIDVLLQALSYTQNCIYRLRTYWIEEDIKKQQEKETTVTYGGE